MESWVVAVLDFHLIHLVVCSGLMVSHSPKNFHSVRSSNQPATIITAEYIDHQQSLLSVYRLPEYKTHQSEEHQPQIRRYQAHV